MGLLDLLKNAFGGSRSGSKRKKPLTCRKCKTEITWGSKVCPGCGTPVKEMFKFSCPKCKEEIEYGAKICVHCGHSFEEKKPSRNVFTCPRCGYKANYRMLRCPACGVKFM